MATETGTSGNDRGRQRKQAMLVAATAIAKGETHRVAASKAKVTERCIRTWIRLPAFQERIKSIHRQMVTRAIGGVTRKLVKNVARLDRVADSADVKAAVSAMRLQLDYWKTLTESLELADMAKQIDELKAALQESHHAKADPKPLIIRPQLAPGDGEGPDPDQPDDDRLPRDDADPDADRYGASLPAGDG